MAELGSLKSGAKMAMKIFCQVRIYNFRDKCVVLARNLKFSNLTQQNMQYIPSLLLGHWHEIMALYYVKSILTEISASRQDRRVLQKSKIIRIKFLSKWGMLQTSRYV